MIHPSRTFPNEPPPQGAREAKRSVNGNADYAAELRKMEETNLAIRQARDLLLTRNHELIAELARSEDKIAELGFEIEDAEAAHGVTRVERDKLAAEMLKLRPRAAELDRHVAALTQSETAKANEIQELREALARLSQEASAPKPAASPANGAPSSGSDKHEVAILVGQLTTAQRARDAALKAEQQARAEHHGSIRELEELRQQLAAARQDYEAQIAALRTEMLASRQPEEAAAPGDDAQVARVTSRIEAAVEAKIAQQTAPPALDFDQFGKSIEHMYDLVSVLQEKPTDLEAAAGLDDQFRVFCETAHAANLAAVHRLAMAGREFTRVLRQSPAKLTRSLPVLNEALSLLGVLALTKGGSEIPDPAGSLVYCVDDDLDNCECVAAALEKITLFTKYAVKPEQGLAELTAMPCDLIILDVNMPGMNGFECCDRLHQLAHHKTTPILFVSGRTSAEEQIVTSTGRVEFLAKPYNLAELSLKALTMILSQRL